MPKDDERKEMTQEEIDNGEEMTVTLTLDDGTELECVVLTIFEAADKEYIALLPLDGNEAEDGEVYYTATQRSMELRISRTSRATRSTRSLLMRSMNFSTPKSTTRL